ncbi:MAG TPA: hypothetical protein VFB68_04140, partial [Xanthobacteraceae bacterium]|nr:hypothetical protein [Xanthobacteraceae bacterium]
SKLLNPVWLWFRNPQFGLAAEVLRISEPPHCVPDCKSAALRLYPPAFEILHDLYLPHMGYPKTTPNPDMRPAEWFCGPSTPLSVFFKEAIQWQQVP